MTMKNIIKLFISATAALMLVNSCEYDTLSTYHGTDQIYFSYANDGSTRDRDSLFVMFGYDRPPKTDTLIGVVVRVMGSMTDYDRPVNFEIDPSMSTAKEGIDIELLHENSMVRAGSNTGVIRVRLFRTETLDGSSDTALVAALRLIDNEHFKTDYKRTDAFIPQTISVATEFRIRFNNFRDRPNLWSPSSGDVETYLNNAFGVYSIKKFDLMCDILPGCSWDMFSYDQTRENPQTVFEERFGGISFLTAWSRMLRFYLEYYEELHGEKLLEDNGEEMTSGVWAN